MPSRLERSPSESAHLPTERSWEEAFSRVESYLRAHHLESRVLLNHLAIEIIQAAREQALATPDLVPVVAAMQVTHARIGSWFARTGNAGDWSDERVRAQGRLALVLADVPGRWAGWFLSGNPVPPELASALAAGKLHPAPELRFSNMPSAPLEFGFEPPADSKPPGTGGWQALRAAAGWLLIVGIFGVAWSASH